MQAQPESPTSKGERTSRLSPHVKRARKTSVKRIKKVSFNNEVEVFHVKSFKNYNQPELYSEKKGCCSCLIF